MSNYKTRVYLEDTDRFGLVYHANYIKYFERGRTEWLREQGVSLEDVFQSGYKILVAKIDVEFLSPAHLDYQLNVQTELSKMKMSIADFSQKLVQDSTNRLIAKANVRLVALDSNDELCHISKIINKEVLNG